VRVRAFDHVGPGREVRPDPGAVAGDGPDRLPGRDESGKDAATDPAGRGGDDEREASCFR
jgi:hypothetical protein